MECCELLGQTECYIRPFTIDNLLTYKIIFEEDQKGKEIQREPEDQKCPFETENLKNTNENTDSQLHNIELTLPTFDENTVNPVLHLKQLDNYINLKKLSNEESKTIKVKGLPNQRKL
jgi:hypothetical protein